MNHLIPTALAAVLLTLPTAQSFCGELPSARFSPEQLRARLLDTQQRIRSIYLEYRSGGYSEESFPKGTYLYRIVAAKAPYSLFHVSAHGHDRLDWHDDFYQQRAYVTARHLYNEFPLNRSYFEHDLKPEAELPGTLPQDFFFVATGIWPLERKPPRPDGRPYVLREIATSKQHSLVRPRLEQVGGRWCHVLEWPDYDLLWIDVERGCSLMARESYSKDNGALVQRIELGEYREVAPRVWLPGWMQNTQFDFNAPTEQGRKRTVLNARHVVLNARVNDVVDAAFQFTRRPGALHISSETAPSQTEPGGLDHLEDLARWIERHTVIPKHSSHVLISYFAGLPAIMIIIVWECWIRWHRKSRHQVNAPARNISSEHRFLEGQQSSAQ